MSGCRRKRGFSGNSNSKSVKNEKTTDESSDEQQQPLLDLFSVLPLGKVKTSLQNNKDVGTIRKPVEKLLDCCAALFLQKLIQDASSTSASTDAGKCSTEAASPTMVIQLQHIQSAAAAAKYTFLEESLQQVQDSSAPKAGLALQKAKKRRVAASNQLTKVPSSSLVGGMARERAQMQQVVDQQALTSSDIVQGTRLEVIEDEDDYD